MRAGTTTNTVPADGSFAVDVRVRTADEQDRVDAAMRSLRPSLPGSVARDHGRPQPAAAGGRARRPRCSSAPRVWPQRLGLPDLDRGRRRRCAPTATSPPASARPTLDGLGAVGGGAHADDEHVLVDALPGRTALLAALVADLLADPTPALETTGAHRP